MNPSTVSAVNNCPFDENAKLIGPWALRTFIDLKYTESANPTLRVRATSGVELTSDTLQVPIALSAVGDSPYAGGPNRLFSMIRAVATVVASQRRSSPPVVT